MIQIFGLAFVSFLFDIFNSGLDQIFKGPNEEKSENDDSTDKDKEKAKPVQSISVQPRDSIVSEIESGESVTESTGGTTIQVVEYLNVEKKPKTKVKIN